ncbi:energy-coupling factor transporter transmembrane component T [Auraticoccus monumenti]|uniref:Energy-coupling factor transport system permease protein n=1 Tax=Auraticoccus monumenti TaxID=675864 RepID=A0A1G6XFI1_9ACTN|nr:energy-coupling factor transporter transmembrane component T [Auraticoccus monumenti]SDD76085.1 energy-coupling factor transport system permease protein [Auraticoccus monumenti]
MSAVLPPRTSWARHRLPRSLHPGAWWAWALALAATASQTTNPLVLVLLVAVVTNVVVSRRGDGPWARSFRLYLALGAFIVVMRVLYRVVFGGGDGGAVLLRLPEVPLPSWVGGIRLLGEVTADAVVYGLQDGLRLAAVVVCVGAANSLANPKRLLAAVPGALYEVGAVLVVSVTVFAQLADSVQRVRRARLLRSATPAGRGVRHRHRVVRAIVVPVLTDALDRSLQLAASMDARGYGRHGSTTPRRRAVTGALVLGGLLLLAFGSYAVVTGALPGLRWLPASDAAWAELDGGVLVLAAGVLLGALGFRHAGRTVRRTRYRPDRWRGPEWLVLVCGLGCLVLVQLVARGPEAAVLVPPVQQWPTLVPAVVVALAVALLPSVLTPPPALTAAPAAAAGGLS